MKNLIGFVGVGQCGGNITSLFEEAGYKTFYINTSLEDLSTLESENYYHISGANGSNHDRSKALGYIKNHCQNIIEQIKNHFKKQEIIYLVFSAGGGTGSGISPLLLDMLSNDKDYKDKTFGAVVILPDINELVNIQVNAYNCIIQLSNIKEIGSIFVLDNTKNNREAINNEFYKSFDSVINLPKYINKKGNIDIAEIKELLSIRGICVISISDSSNSTSIIKSLEQSYFNYQKDKNLVYVALSLKDDIDMNSLINYTGKPFDMFINYNTEKTICCLSGMSFPKDRIEVIKNIIDNQRNEIALAVENSKNNSIDNKLEWNIQLKKVVNEFLDFNQIFAKY